MKCCLALIVVSVLVLQAKGQGGVEGIKARMCSREIERACAQGDSPSCQRAKSRCAGTQMPETEETGDNNQVSAGEDMEDTDMPEEEEKKEIPKIEHKGVPDHEPLPAIDSNGNIKDNFDYSDGDMGEDETDPTEQPPAEEQGTTTVDPEKIRIAQEKLRAVLGPRGLLGLVPTDNKIFQGQSSDGFGDLSGGFGDSPFGSDSVFGGDSFGRDTDFGRGGGLTFENGFGSGRNLNSIGDLISKFTGGNRRNTDDFFSSGFK